MTDASDPPEDAESTETKGERTRRRILENAVEQFGRHGFRQTSVTEISREAGLTQAASYAYFENKEALFRAAVDSDVEGLIDSVLSYIEETPVLQLLPTVLIVLADRLQHHPLAVRVLSGLEPDAIGQLRDLPALLAVRSRLEDRLRDGQRAGEVRSDIDPTVVATGTQVILVALLTSLVRGTSSEAESSSPPQDTILGILGVFDALLRVPATT